MREVDRGGGAGGGGARGPMRGGERCAIGFLMS